MYYDHVVADFTRDAWRTAVVSVLVAGNLVPAFCSYRFLSVLKKADSAYNLLFQVGVPTGRSMLERRASELCVISARGEGLLNNM